MSTSASLSKPKRPSETKRIRHVHRYYPSALRGADLCSALNNPDAPFPPLNYLPRSSKDASLTAFAQLAAIRLGVARAMIALIDRQEEHILTEASPTLSLRNDNRHGPTDELWLGNATIPRSCSMCNAILDLDVQSLASSETKHKVPAVVINDLSKDDRFSTNPFVRSDLHLRFYAAVPLLSRGGLIIGSLCVMDSVPHAIFGNEELLILRDMAATVMDYLMACKVKEEHRRGEQMVRGLISFVDGATSLLPLRMDDQHTYSPQHYLSVQRLPSRDRNASPMSGSGNGSDAETLRPQSPSVNEAAPHTPSEPHSYRPLDDDQHVSSELPAIPPPLPPQIRTDASSGFVPRTKSGEGLTTSTEALDSILSAHSRSMFSRAANIIRETSELEGVVIFDAASAARSDRSDRRNADRSTSASLSSGSETYSSRYNSSSSEHKLRQPPSHSSQDLHRRLSNVLAFSTKTTSSISGGVADFSYRALDELELKAMLRKYRGGKVINFNLSGEISNTDESDASSSSTARRPHLNRVTSSKSDARTSRKHRISEEAIQKIAPGARSVAFVPLWDYDRSRWFAACLCWTTRNDRILSPDIDLVYLQAFGNSIMTELSRLDALAANKARTTFVASISHELRSPLHGILGGIEFMHGTPLDAFQASMLHSIDMCGKTLLDTLNHVLDYSKISEFARTQPSARVEMKSPRHVRVTAKRSKTLAVPSLTWTVDLSVVTEEVVEAVFSGQSYRTISARMDDDQGKMSTPGHSQRVLAVHDDTERKLVLVILDIPSRPDWRFRMQPGAWRRILMNIFGNALKYTHTGFVSISVRAVECKHVPGHDPDTTEVTLSVTDTGIGISPNYLANRLYTPFTQEDSFSAGTGLGLSMSRQIVESIGGRIDLKSEVRVGTEVKVLVTVSNAKAPQANTLQESDGDAVKTILPRTRGRSVYILRRPAHATLQVPEMTALASHAVSRLCAALAATLKDWFGMNVTESSEWQDNSADIVICSEPSFDYLATIRARRKMDGKAPITIFLAVDAIEASVLRNDARITSKESVVEICTQPLGPHKLAKALQRCLDRYTSATENQPMPRYDLTRATSTDAVPGPAKSATSSSQFRRRSSSPLTDRRISSLSESAISRHVGKLDLHPNGSPTMGQDPNTQLLNVLIVDDNVINRRLLVAFMKKHNFKFEEAANGMEAVEAYRKAKSPRFDVILMDISMPIMDGMDATREIRKYEQKRSLKAVLIVALTGLASASARSEATYAGVDHFLTKPLRFQALMPLLESVMRE